MKDSVKEKGHIIGFEAQDYRLHVIITEDILKSRYKRNDILKSMFPDEDQPGGLMCHSSAFDGYIFLKYDADVNVIAHESFHAICHMMDSIGASLTDSSEECYAYPLGYVSGEIYKFIKSVKKEFKIKNKDAKIKSK